MARVVEEEKEGQEESRGGTRRGGGGGGAAGVARWHASRRRPRGPPRRPPHSPGQDPEEGAHSSPFQWVTLHALEIKKIYQRTVNNVNLSVLKLEKRHLHQNGVEFHHKKS